MREPRGDRVEAVRRLLERAGVDGRARVAGGDGEIVAVRARVEMRERLAELAPEIRTLGFRYVALELGEGTTYNGNQ